MEIPLGKHTIYPDQYDASLLFPVARSMNREQIGIARALPFFGYDHWRAYEVSWLNADGMPQVALADILIPCESPDLIESKSMKLYFNSLNQHRFDSVEALQARVCTDLSAAAGAPVVFRLVDLQQAQAPLISHVRDAELLDEIPIRDPAFEPDAALLLKQSDNTIDAVFVSHLFRSNCPVTSQPDWGSIVIEYSGPEPVRQSLLAYILSYRTHTGFHEHCVEQIFNDLRLAFMPAHLKVSINFTRRGGLEINPVRSLHPILEMQPLGRFVRQ